MFEFAHWWALLLLPLPLVSRLMPPIIRRQSALKIPGIPAGLKPVEQSDTGVHRQNGIYAIIWFSLILSAANPQWLGEPVPMPQKARDLMLAVDLSGSMQTPDMSLAGRQVDRLTMVKSVVSDFIQRRKGDRVGLILFADTAYLQTPLTLDTDTVQQMLNETVIGLVGDQTAIGDAVGLAAKRFEKRQASNRVLVLLTDGQNTAGNIAPEEALTLAKSADLTIYTIGVGAEQMQVQSFFGTRTVNPSRDIDEDLLRQLANQTNGQYFRATDTQSLEQIYATLDTLEPIEREAQQFRPLTALFYYPLALALALSLFAAFIQLAPLRKEVK